MLVNNKLGACALTSDQAKKSSKNCCYFQNQIKHTYVEEAEVYRDLLMLHIVGDHYGCG